MLKKVGVRKGDVHILQEKIDNASELILQLFEHCHLDSDEESNKPEYKYLIGELINPVIKKERLTEYEFYDKVYGYAKESALVEKIIEKIVHEHADAISFIINGGIQRVTYDDIHNISPIQLILLFAQAHLRVATSFEFIDFKIRKIDNKQIEYAKLMIFLIQQTDNPVFKASVVPKSVLREVFVDPVETATAEPFVRTWHSYFTQLFNSILPARYGHSAIAERSDVVRASAVVVPSTQDEGPGAREDAIYAIERKWFALNKENHTDTHVYTDMSQFISLVSSEKKHEIQKLKTDIASIVSTRYSIEDKSKRFADVAARLVAFNNKSFGYFFQSIKTTAKQIALTPKIRNDALRVRVEQELLRNVRIALGKVYQFDKSELTYTARRDDGYSFWRPGDPGSVAGGGSVLNFFLRKTRKGRKSNKRGNKKSRTNKRR